MIGRARRGSLLAILVALCSSLSLACKRTGPGGVGGPPGAASRGGAGGGAAAAVTVAMMPKNKGNPYFIAARKGAEEAARELGVTLLWDGPTETDPAKQNEVVEAWITRGVDAISVSVENRDGLATVLRKARSKGIKVVTFDADTAEDARDFLVNQATPEGIGHALVDNAARILGGKGEFAVITASLTAANQNTWLAHVKRRLGEKYPDMKLAVVRPSDDKQDVAFTEAQNILKVHPQVRLIMGICSPAVPGAAEAVKQAGKAADVKVTGLSLPNTCRKYIHDGVVDSIILWNVSDLGYLTIHAAAALARGALKPGAKALAAGRLGNVEIQGTEILLGKPFVFDKTNVDRFNF
jgi:rhamnose transport system permease protein